jgi:membrane protein implicated in regulation of membrane protease activity
MWHIWAIIGIILIVLEMFTFIPGFFMAGLGIASLLTAIAAYYHLSLVIQLAIFAVSSFLICIFVLPSIRHRFYNVKNERKTGIDAYAGKTAKVVQKIENATGSGRVKIYEEEWKAISVSGEIIEENQMVNIKEIKDQTMFVEKI